MTLLWRFTILILRFKLIKKGPSEQSEGPFFIRTNYFYLRIGNASNKVALGTLAPFLSNSD